MADYTVLSSIYTFVNEVIHIIGDLLFGISMFLTTKSKNKTRPILISIEGNIGAGKSTIISKMQQKYKNRKDIIFLQEPVGIWETIHDKYTNQNMLQKFYENPKKYAFAFQIMAYMTRLHLLENVIQNVTDDCKVIVMERSLEADYHTFSKMLYDDSLMEEVEYKIYNMVSQQPLEKYSMDGIIWINTDVNTCEQRIMKRNREGESKIDREYLTNCNKYHDEWLNVENMNHVFMFDDSKQDLQEIEEFIFSFCHK
jgi:deoxyadenosine/deoxycytidine kinase